MVVIFPRTRIHTVVLDGVIHLPKKSEGFFPRESYVATQSEVDKFKFFSIYAHESWYKTLEILGFDFEQEPLPRGAVQLEPIFRRDAVLRFPRESLDYLSIKKTENVTLISQGSSVELWERKAFELYESMILEQWETDGSIDTKLVMHKWHAWSRLRARVVVQPHKTGYRTTAELKSDYLVLKFFDYVTHGKYKTTRDLGRIVLSLFDAYLEGATNIPEILAVHQRYGGQRL